MIQAIASIFIILLLGIISPWLLLIIFAITFGIIILVLQFIEYLFKQFKKVKLWRTNK